MMETTVSTRERIIRAAMELLTSGGRGAVSTRAVSAAAGVQPPTIYRQFGDMRGLLDVVASRGFAGYIESKLARDPGNDPIDDLRHGWDLHVAFGLANPAVYVLMYGDPRPDASFTAARAAADLLRGQMQRVAEAGRLRVGVERAAAMIHAAGVGVTLSLLAAPPARRDLRLPELTREAVLAAITTDGSAANLPVSSAADRLASRSVALKAILSESAGILSPGEQTLLTEWLDRLGQSAG